MHLAMLSGLGDRPLSAAAILALCSSLFGFLMFARCSGLFGLPLRAALIFSPVVLDIVEARVHLAAYWMSGVLFLSLFSKERLPTGLGFEAVTPANAALN